MQMRLALLFNAPGDSHRHSFPEAAIAEGTVEEMVPTVEETVALMAARSLDEQVGVFGWSYELLEDAPDEPDFGYHVWRVDADVPGALVESLMSLRHYVGFVAASPPPARGEKFESRQSAVSRH